MNKTVVVIILALGLGGCVTDGSTQSLKPVCDALIGPIKYSSTNTKSRRFAGRDLAPDLAQRNRVGVNLKCETFK